MDWTLRSCWLCNPAHEHLKSVKQLQCIGCGKLFVEGVEVGSGESLLEAFEASPQGRELINALWNTPQPKGEPLVVEDLDLELEVVQYTKTPTTLKKTGE